MRLLPILLLMFSCLAWSQSGSFIWPTEGRVINGFDTSSKGIDIAGKVGQPVVAAGDGKVLYAKNMRGYGNVIIVEHSGSMVTAYAHNKTILVREGQMVTQGQQIAEMGDSDADTVKLRFQMRHMGKPIDPMTLLRVPLQNSLIARVADANEASAACAFFISTTVKSNTSFPEMSEPLVVTLRIRLTPSRMLKEVKIVSASEIPEFDAQIERGIRKSGRFPQECPEDFLYRHALNDKLPRTNTNSSSTKDITSINAEPNESTEGRGSPEGDKKPRELAKVNRRVNLQVIATPPTSDGEYVIFIQTNADTASLKINGEELGGKADGHYTINRVARAGQDTTLDVTAKDVFGNTDSKTIIVSRAIVESKTVYAALNPVQVKRQVERDAVAIIIGIANYQSLPKAEFANDDARVFYDYAIRALGVKPENIKLLVDADADEVEIIKAFKTWLPSRVKSTTDVYVFYSGHGLPTQDGQGLYLLPPRADRDFISRTAIQFQEINADLQAAKPKSVTIFMDACYSGQARSGETLVANARPVTLKAEKKLFPDNFTVITASQADQISSSSPDLKHGIFSYYLMKGMEGDADTNKDGKITLGEMQAYLVENVGRQAGMMSRKQEPQLIGDADRVLVGK
jgi:hypothetical protein